MSKECDRIPKRPLGKTGYQVTIYGLGGLFTTSMHDRHDEAVEIVNRAIDLGVNYIDTSALYGNGASELNICAPSNRWIDSVRRAVIKCPEITSRLNLGTSWIITGDWLLFYLEFNCSQSLRRCISY